MRTVALSALATIFAVLAIQAIGRAVDHETEQRFLNVRHGVPYSCKILHYEDGSAVIGDCERVEP